MTSSFTSLQDILLRKKKTSKIGKVIEASMVISVFYTVVDEIFGRVCSNPKELISEIVFQKDTLKISASNAAMSNELHLRKWEIQNLINEKLQAEVVAKIRIRT